MLTRETFHKRFGTRPLLGMVHLGPLPGAPQFAGSLIEVIENAIRDARAIREGGAHGLMVENFGDKPFTKRVGPETVAAMTRVITEIRHAVDLPLGVNVLRNDGISAMAIAATTDAEFIRINIHTGAMVTDQGVIEGEAAAVLRARKASGAENVAILADHMVKHAAPLAPVDPEQSAKDLRLRGLADVIVVTGRATGSEADPTSFSVIRRVVPDAPVLLGSGLTVENAERYRDLVDGFIVGTSIKVGGDVDSPVDPKRVEELVRVVRG